jgi:hypothetical protein
MSTRFEILKNGERISICGINGDGVLSVNLSYIKHPGQELTHRLAIGGLGMFDGAQDSRRLAGWPSPDVTTGDEITIRILPAGEYDQPDGMTRSQQEVVEDPDFGQLCYNIDSWDAEIPFDSAPLKSAHIHIRADDSGPTDRQRQIVRELRMRHVQLWPDICSALVKCHPDIETTDELISRLVSQLCINMYDDSTNIELTYSVHGDPDFRSYFIRLRDWAITEVFMVE